MATEGVRGGRSHVTTWTATLALLGAWADGPKAASNLVLDAPIERWDHAIPLGNGLTGGLLWGDGGNLKLSLDRSVALALPVFRSGRQKTRQHRQSQCHPD